MANLIATSQVPLFDGMPFTFRAACDCTEITGLKIQYPSITESGSSATSKTFTFVDAHGTALTGLGNLFASGAYVRVVLDTTRNHAYIQNADTNAYIEAQLEAKAASSHNHSASNITSGALAVARGGTGSSNGATGLKNLFAAGNTVLSSYQYGTSLPAAGTKGRIFFKKVSS